MRSVPRREGLLTACRLVEWKQCRLDDASTNLELIACKSRFVLPSARFSWLSSLANSSSCE